MKKFDSETIQSVLRDLKGWTYKEGCIEKEIVFNNFKDALAAMVRIGFEAENMDHHPEWSNVYNKLNIRLKTHAAEGVTEKDFFLAKKIEEIISQMKIG